MDEQHNTDLWAVVALMVSIIAIGITIAVYNYSVTKAYLRGGFTEQVKVLTTTDTHSREEVVWVKQEK